MPYLQRFVQNLFYLKPLFLEVNSNEIVTTDCNRFKNSLNKITLHKKGNFVMPEFEALAKRLKELRKAKNESQFEFAENCGLSDDIISQLENQKTNPKLSSLQDIAAYLGITVSDLLKVDEQHQSEYVFRLRKDTITGEDKKQHLVYGIDILSSSGENIKSIPDIFLNEKKAKEFVSLCNSEELDIIHIYDVIEDVLT
jgi:transcriptional regulator with XRE-family HTH domain